MHEIFSRELIAAQDSYWQRGCDDAKAGRPYTPPTKAGEHDKRNTGYANGYDYAKTAYQMAAVGKRILARALADEQTRRAAQGRGA